MGTDHRIEPADDDLFAGLEGVGRRTPTHVEADPVPPFTHGGCPLCTKDKVGLILQNGHLAWAGHPVRTWGGISRPCAAEGQRLCDLPARDVRFLSGLDTPLCTCVTRI